MQLLETVETPLPSQLQVHLKGIKRGIEKESLRILANGRLSLAPHPSGLGASLTNDYITTDYSEALPEFITKASEDRLRPIAELTELHQFAYRHLGDEILWSMSMPCIMGEEKDIPIARYGSSNQAKMKEIYRLGLGVRYGRLMQTIAGVHYNFSLPEAFWQAHRTYQGSDLALDEYISQSYMGLIRNYLRTAWLIPLFFGASPALCESFLKDKNVDLDVLVPGTRYGKYATSLRMSDLGYQNKVQSRLNVSHNSLKDYIQGLEQAISTSDPLYQELGVKVNGEYQQLNANILQIENEFYGPIRPKRVARSGERPSLALKKGGVEYLEIRALDLNPFSPVGVSQDQIAFLDCLLLACLFAKSPIFTQREIGEYQENLRSVVRNGRHPDLCLTVKNRCKPLKEVASDLLNKLNYFAGILDQVYQTHDHVRVIASLQESLNDLSTSFSGQIIKTIEQRMDGFFPYAMEISKAHKQSLLALPWSPELASYYQQEALRSHAAQKAIEQQDQGDFEDFLAEYYSRTS